MNVQSAEYEYSGIDGVMSIPWKVTCLQQNLDIQLQFDIDGVVLETLTLKVNVGGNFDTYTPSHIEVPNIGGYVITQGQQFGSNFIFQAWNSYCGAPSYS